MDSTITRIHGREILDSRGNPTVEVEVTLACGITARAGVPSGASTGSREAVELRDGDTVRYGGKGVRTTVAGIEETIAPNLIGMDACCQGELDATMITLDGTANKARLGANAILGVSMACARAAADASGLPVYPYLGGPGATRLPVPLMNILNGGVHAHGQGADIQEYMIAPYGAATLREAVRWGSEIYRALQEILLSKGLSVGVGDEGGFAPHVRSNREPLDLIVSAIEQVGLRPGADVGIAMDPASSEFFKAGRYELKSEGRQLTSDEMVAYYESMVADYPICLLEDGLAESDWESWKLLNRTLGAAIELVGDDIFCTNPAIIARAIEEDVANSTLIKLNQIGTLTETIAATRLAQFHGWGAFVSHRSGETVDSFIADMTVALDTGHLKTGAPCRGERVEKYNQLMRIEEGLGPIARYAGKTAFCRPPRY
jgi:enolase